MNAPATALAPALPRALAIDDEPAILSTFRRAFRRDLDMITESDPAVALAHLAARPFDVIFVDYAMPRMNGVSFLETVRRLRPECRCYLVTAHAGTDEITDAVRRGLAAGVIAKPWSRADILACVAAKTPEPA